MSQSTKETLDEFRKSFSYGKRTDLLFKFLASENFTDQEAGQIIWGLLRELGSAFDTGDYNRVRQYVYEWQVQGYAPKPEEEGVSRPYRYDSAPWAPLSKPLSQSRLALISTGGLFVEGDDPLGPDGPTQEEAILQIADFLRRTPKLSRIPRDVDPSRLRVRHPGYDIRGTLRDYNVVFPLERLKEMVAASLLGELAGMSYSFVGAAAQRPLLSETAPALAKELKAGAVDAALLVAA